MDQSLIDEFKTKLETEKDELTKELDSVSDPDVGDHVPGERAPKFPNYGDDALDDTDESPGEVSDYEINVSVTGRLESKFKAVDAALTRISEGKYGVCEKCSAEISKERLEADPSAALCITCAKTHV